MLKIDKPEKLLLDRIKKLERQLAFLTNKSRGDDKLIRKFKNTIRTLDAENTQLKQLLKR